MISLSVKAEEGGTYAITGIKFVDESGDSVLPNSDPTWSLCKENGDLVDSGTIMASLNGSLVLSGDQLLISDNELANYNTIQGKKVYYVNRSVFIKGFIDSTLGTNLPITQEFIFTINNITCLS